jgi:EpsD family peptidyl-prolyl cis-trans isomerase
MRMTGLAAAAVLAVVLLAGCGGGRDGARATQVVAKVNDGELSVHQVNHHLQRIPGVPAERLAEVRREVLERLIDQELAVQFAKDAKLDRDAEVLQRIDAARRDVLARAWFERVASQVTKPDAGEIDTFFREHPALFAERRIWRLNEIVLPAQPPNWPQIERELDAVKSAVEAAAVLRRRGIDTAIATDIARASETVPLDALARFAKLKPGDVATYMNGPQVVIVEVRSFQPAPLDATQARAPIEQYLMNRRRLDAIQAESKRLREGAKIRYMGEFAGATAAGGPASPAPPASAPPTPAASPSREAIDKGIGGLR